MCDFAAKVYNYCRVAHYVLRSDIRYAPFLADVGTYFCERLSKKALRNKFSFRAPGGGGEEGAVDFAVIYKRLFGKRDIDFLYHVDSEYLR